MRDKKPYNLIDPAIRLYESGKTLEEVAKILGTTERVIQNALKKFGYKCRVPKNVVK